MGVQKPRETFFRDVSRDVSDKLQAVGLIPNDRALRERSSSDFLAEIQSVAVVSQENFNDDSRGSLAEMVAVLYGPARVTLRRRLKNIFFRHRRKEIPVLAIEGLSEAPNLSTDSA